eukprot:gene4850-6067_t
MLSPKGKLSALWAWQFRPPFELSKCSAIVPGDSPSVAAMCNLYSQTKSQDAMRHIFDVVEDDTGNLPPLTGIFPDYPAPIITATPQGRHLSLARWGMPTPPQFLTGKRSDPGVPGRNGGDVRERNLARGISDDKGRFPGTPLRIF